MAPRNSQSIASWMRYPVCATRRITLLQHAARVWRHPVMFLSQNRHMLTLSNRCYPLDQAIQANGAKMSKTNLEVLEIVKSSKELDDAMSFFMAEPSFSSKQKALELLLGHISKSGLPSSRRTSFNYSPMF